jgi:hypothetical protein
MIGIVLAGVSVAVAIFAALAWRSVAIRTANSSEARRRFAQVRAGFAMTMPLVQRDASGRFVRREDTAGPRQPATELRVMAYVTSQERLVEADVPLWFFHIKGPAAQIALRGTSFDLETLGLTATDLERAGATIVLDESRPDGDQLLAWTQ